jgi:hypothetical protein
MCGKSAITGEALIATDGLFLTSPDHLLNAQSDTRYQQQTDTAVDRRSTATGVSAPGTTIVALIVALVVPAIKDVLEEVVDPIDQTAIVVALVVATLVSSAPAGAGKRVGTSQYQQAEQHHHCKLPHPFHEIRLSE